MKKTTELTISRVYGRQLRQIKGISAAKAQAIMELFPTPRALYEEYTKLELQQRLHAHNSDTAQSENGPAAANAPSTSTGRAKGKGKKAQTEEMGPVLPEHLLKDVACGAQQRNLGPKLSQFVAMLHLNREYV
jgi:hypothetical protein